MNLKEYRNHLLAASLSESTVKQRLYHLDVLNREHPDLLRVTTADLEAFLADRRSLSAEYRKSFLSSFRVYFGWARRTGLIVVDPTEGLERIRIPKKLPRIAADSEIEFALLNADPLETAWIRLGRECGLRLSEIAGLPLTARVYNRLHVTGKGGRERIVPIGAELLELLVELEETTAANGYYFPGRFGGHVEKSTVWRHIRELVGKNPHALRHAAGTSGYRGTHNIRAVQEFLGHASLNTTQIYVHVSGEELDLVGSATALRRRTLLAAVPTEPPPRIRPLAA
jgi:site-specific recombinase XerD